MPWIGPSDAVMAFLAQAGADEGEDGRFIISGEAVTSGMGGAEIIVPDGTVYFVKRRPLNLAAAMKASGEGFGGFRLLEHGPGYRANPWELPAPGTWEAYQMDVSGAITDRGEAYGAPPGARRHMREEEAEALHEGSGIDDTEGPAYERLRADYEAGVSPQDVGERIFQKNRRGLLSVVDPLSSEIRDAADSASLKYLDVVGLLFQGYSVADADQMLLAQLTGEPHDLNDDVLPAKRKRAAKGALAAWRRFYKKHPPGATPESRKRKLIEVLRASVAAPYPQQNPKGPAIWKTVAVKTGPSTKVPIYIWSGRGVPTEKDFLDAPPFTIFPSHNDLGRRRLPVGEKVDVGDAESGPVIEMAWWAGERDPPYDEEVQAVLAAAGLLEGTGPTTEYLTDIIDVPDDLQGQTFDWGRGRVKLKGAYQAYPWAVELGYTLIKVPDALTGKTAKYAEVFILDEERSKGDKYWTVQTPRRKEFASKAIALGTAAGRRPARNPGHGIKKDVQRLVKEAERQGCTVTRSKRRAHYMVRCPGGTVTMSSTPSHRGAIKSMRGDLRRAGVVLNPAGDAEAAIRLFMEVEGELEQDSETAQFFPGPEGELLVRVAHPGYMSTLLLGGHGTSTDDRMIEVLRELLRQEGFRPTWSQAKGGGKWRMFKFRPAQQGNPEGWTLETATYLASVVAGRLIEGEREELASGEPLTPMAAGNLLLAYGYLYQAYFIALGLGAAELAARMADAMEGIVIALGAGCGIATDVGALGMAPSPSSLPNPESMVLELGVLNKAARDAAEDLERAKDERQSFKERFPLFLRSMGSAAIAAAAAHGRGNRELVDQMETVKEELLLRFGQDCATTNMERIEAGTAGSFSQRWKWSGGGRKKKGKKKKGRKGNPTPERHRRAYNAYIQSAGHHLQRGADLLEKGRRLPAFRALRHAECDIRQAYTEAVYSKKDDADLQTMTGPLESLYQGVQGQLRELEARL